MATTFMNLSLPTPTVTLGPAWATQLNLALEVIDAHDHTSTKGAKITPPAININSALSFNSNLASNLFATQFIEQSAGELTGINNARSIYVHNGNLYYTNADGNYVQITSGVGLAPASAASVKVLAYEEIITTSTTPFIDNDIVIKGIKSTSASIAVTLPSAASVSPGRIFVIKDVSTNSETYPITINPSGDDTIDKIADSTTIASNGEALMLVSDGISNWFAV